MLLLPKKSIKRAYALVVISPGEDDGISGCDGIDGIVVVVSLLVACYLTVTQPVKPCDEIANFRRKQDVF